MVRQVDNVIVTSMPRGRILAMHDHRRWRVAKKYHRAMVFQRPLLAKDNLPTLLRVLLDIRPYLTDKALRRVCKVLRKHKVDARVER